MLYLSLQHLENELKISRDELLDFERRGVIRSVTKNGNTFYSSRDLYKLRGILHFVRNKGLSVDQAVEHMDQEMKKPALVPASSRQRQS